MGSLYTCIETCFHNGTVYQAGDTVNFEDDDLLPINKNGEVIRFQKIGDNTPVAENQEQSLFENMAKELGYTDRDIRGVNPGKGSNGQDLEPYGALYLVLEQHNSVELSKAIKVLEKLSNGQGIKVVRKATKTQAEKDIEDLENQTKAQLIDKAKEKGIAVKSKATKKELVNALGE